MGKRPTSRRCDLLPLLPSGPDGVQRELAVWDLPNRCGVSPRKGAILYYLGMRCVPAPVGGPIALRGKIALSRRGGEGMEDGRMEKNGLRI